MVNRPETVTRRLPLQIDRRFALDRVVATHSSMILRSTKRNDGDNRIDILFAGMFALKLCRSLPILNVTASD